MVQFSTGTDKLVCTFTGSLDTIKCMEFEKEICEKVRGLKIPVIFDMQGVDYVSSKFLGICILVSKEVGPENLMLADVCPSVKKVFKIAGFDKIITIE